MAEPKYQAYTGKKTSLLKNLSSASDAYAKYKQDEEDKLAQQQIIDAQKAAAEAEDKPWYATAGEWIGARAGDVGNFVKGAAEQVAKDTSGFVQNSANVVEGVYGQQLSEATNEMRKIVVDEHNKNMEKLVDLDNPEDPRWDSKEVKEENRKFQDALDSLDAKNKEANEHMQQTQDVDANEYAGQAANTFLNVATLGTGTVPKVAAEQAVKQGFGTVVKGAIRGGAEGSTFGAAGGAISGAQENEDPGKILERTLQGATVGGILGTTMGGVGSAVEVKANNKNAKVNEAKAADEADLAANPFRDTTDEELLQQVKDFQGGKRSDDVTADYENFQSVKDELGKRQREAYKANGGISKEEAQKALDDFDSGASVPDSVYKPAEPIQRANDLLLLDKTPPQINEVAKGIMGTRKSLEDQMDKLMSPNTKQVETSRLDAKYGQDLQVLERKFTSPEANAQRLVEGDVNKIPNGSKTTGGEYTKDVRYISAKRKLDEAYEEATGELDMLEAQDAPEVAAFQEKLDDLSVHESQFVNDVNKMMEENPDAYRAIDGAERDAQRQVLQEQLTQAERFDTPENVVTETAVAPDPVKSFNANEDAPEAYRSELSKEISEAAPSLAETKFQHIEGIQASALRTMSPSQALEKMGLRGPELDLHSNIIRAMSEMNLANKADSEVLLRISKSVQDNKAAQGQIIDYLEGKRQTITAVDADAAKMIKEYLDTKKSGLEKLGFKTLDNYFPHIFDKRDPEVQRLFKGKVTGEISFGNLKQRLTDSDDYNRDIMEVLVTYTNGYNRKTILEPALKPLGDLKTQVKLQEAEGKWIDDYINQLMGYDQSNTGKSYNQFMDGVYDKVGLTNLVGKNHYSEALGTQRMISAAATMGLNPGTAIRNMTQVVNTVADIGPRYATIGAVDGTRMLLTKEGREELARVGIMDGGVSQNYFDAIQNAGVRGRIAKSRDGAIKGLMFMIRATDISLRAQAYSGAKALARAKGMTGKAAEDFAIRHTVDTQFITSRADMPLAFNGQGIRSLTQLATFSGKQAGFLKRMGVKMVKGADGKGFQIKDLGSVLAGVLTAGVATAALQPVIGMKPTEWIPFYDQIAPFFGAEGDSLYRSPIVTLLAGNGRGKTGLIQALQGVDTNGDGSENVLEGLGKFFEDNWSQLVPAGTQIKKTSEGLETTIKGISKNSSGNIRFQQNTDPNSVLQGALFGQYSTPNGQKWVQDGFPTLTDTQTKEVKMHPAEQAQYIDYYQAIKKAGGRQKAYDAVKAELLAGNIPGAQREAQTYNDALTKSMNAYWKKHDNMPKELQDKMLSSYIDVQRAADNQDLDLNIDELDEE